MFVRILEFASSNRHLSCIRTIGSIWESVIDRQIKQGDLLNAESLIKNPFLSEEMIKRINWVMLEHYLSGKTRYLETLRAFAHFFEHESVQVSLKMAFLNLYYLERYPRSASGGHQDRFGLD